MLSLFFLLASAQVLAADTDTKSPLIQERPAELVSASALTEFSKRAGPWPISLLKTATFDTQPFSEKLNALPGLQAREVGSPTVSIRGSAAADRVLKLYEGVPLNLADGLGGASLFLPDEAIDEVRYFKGPASAFFGASALAGAIDYRLRRFEKPTLRASLATPQDNSFLIASPIRLGRDFGRNWGQLTAAHARKVGHRANDIAEVTRAAGVADIQSGRFSIQPRLVVAKALGESPGSIYTPFRSTYAYSGLLSSINVSAPFAQRSSFALRLSDVRQWGLFDRDTALASTSAASRSSLSADLRTEPAEGFAARSFFDIDRDSLTASYLGDKAFEQSAFAVGQSFELALTPTLILQPVVRYLTESGEIIKALALVRADADGRQWFTYAEGFRAASLSDRFSDLSYFKGNPGLKPERSRGVEIGFERTFVRTQLGGNAFFVRYDNLFDTAAVSSVATTKINAGQAVTKGMELFFSHQCESFKFRGSTGYLDAKNETVNERLRLSPQHQSAAGVTYAKHNFAVGLQHTVWSSILDREAPSNAIKELSGWSSTDFDLRYDSGSWEVALGVLNIGGITRELTYGYPEAGRRVYLSAARFF